MDAPRRTTLLLRYVTMSNFFLFLTVGFAITNALVYLHLFHWLRKLVSGVSDNKFCDLSLSGNLYGIRQTVLGRLFRCHTCIGFWVGIVLTWIEFNWSIKVHPIIGGFLLSGFNFILWTVLVRLGVHKL